MPKTLKGASPQYWTVAQCAAVWGIAERVARRYFELNRVPGQIKPGRNYYAPAGTLKPADTRGGARQKGVRLVAD